jgi:hypothetical protein
MEGLEQAKAREARRLSKSILDPTVVYSVRDIKRVVAELDPKKNPESHDIEITTQMEVDGDTYEVRANTRSRTKRDMLIEGLNVIKRRVESADELLQSGDAVEIDGVNMRPIPIGSGVEGRSWVDPLISQWTGGFRVGIHICWDLDEYRYKYDVFEHKLTRIRTDATGSSTTSTVQAT